MPTSIIVCKKKKLHTLGEHPLRRAEQTSSENHDTGRPVSSLYILCLRELDELQVTHRSALDRSKPLLRLARGEKNVQLTYHPSGRMQHRHMFEYCCPVVRDHHFTGRGLDLTREAERQPRLPQPHNSNHSFCFIWRILRAKTYHLVHALGP